MNIQVDPTSSNLASAMLNSKIRPRAVVGYGVKIFHPSPPNYVTRSPGEDDDNANIKGSYSTVINYSLNRTLLLGCTFVLVTFLKHGKKVSQSQSKTTLRMQGCQARENT